MIAQMVLFSFCFIRDSVGVRTQDPQLRRPIFECGVTRYVLTHYAVKTK